jgi:hypothetical protein
VRLNGVTLEDAEAGYTPVVGDVWQVGRRRYVRVGKGSGAST